MAANNVGNLHALKTGTRLNQLKQRLTVGELPSKMLAVKREARKYRRELEAQVCEAKGEVNFTDAHYVDTATSATMAAGIIRWLLRNRLEELKANDIGRMGLEITKAKEKRDAAVRALELNKPPADPWADVDAQILEGNTV